MQPLPERPNLEHLRRQAKELLKQARNGDPSATERVLRGGRQLNLASAQRALAREHGLRTWSDLVLIAGAIRTLNAGPAHAADDTEFGGRDEDPDYDEMFEDLEHAHVRGRCPHCGAGFEFETNILPGFADHIEAFCPACGGTLGKHREDLGVRIRVRLLESPS